MQRESAWAGADADYLLPMASLWLAPHTIRMCRQSSAKEKKPQIAEKLPDHIGQMSVLPWAYQGRKQATDEAAGETSCVF